MTKLNITGKIGINEEEEKVWFAEFVPNLKYAKNCNVLFDWSSYPGMQTFQRKPFFCFFPDKTFFLLSPF